MNIIKVMGGLGNQMFQYAFYRSLINQGVDALLDISLFTQPHTPIGALYQLETLFDIKAKYISTQDLDKLNIYAKNRYLRALKRRLRLKIINKTSIGRYTYVMETKYYKNKDFIESQYLNPCKTVYFDGFWQNEEFFYSLSDILQSELTFKKPLDCKNLDILKKIQSTQSVAIHIRRYSVESTDYHDKPLDYYLDAINMVNAIVEDPTYYIFSNDPEWCKANIPIEDGLFIELNSALEDQYKDMQLMSYCPICITADSTFSWWGAWLNPQNIHKTIIAPRYIGFLGQKNTIFPVAKGWITIDK